MCLYRCDVLIYFEKALGRKSQLHSKYRTSLQFNFQMSSDPEAGNIMTILMAGLVISGPTQSNQKGFYLYLNYFLIILSQVS